MNWQDGAPPAQTGAYDPLLSEASCGDTASQLALSHRPAREGEIQLASLEKEELAFLEGIQPAGGEGDGTGTGGDGPGGNGPLNEVLKDLDDQTQNGDGGDGGTGGGGGGGGGGPFITSFAPGDPGNPGNPGDPGNPGNPGDPGNPGNPGDPGNPGNGPGDEPCTENCEEKPIQTACEGDCTPPTETRLQEVEVPEPAALGLFGLGLLMLGIGRRRSK
ncbi:collagen-like triple helix repeat-containing protein [Desertibaculum subflavum]|uniref:collagen-like triple helix repeat-containing protein n=1 Tax=Desertibaculum subflavum TaxID=2268458 RepID=UPI0013C4DA7A